MHETLLDPGLRRDDTLKAERSDTVIPAQAGMTVSLIYLSS